MTQKTRLISSQPVTLFFYFALVLMAGCGAFQQQEALPADQAKAPDSYDYVIGPGDSLNVFVWRNPDVSINNVPVRPDGKISTPLVEDMIASGKTPTQLAEDIEEVLSEVIKDPFVTVTVMDFVGEFNQQIRVVGEAAVPSALPYSNEMTLLDVMIAVGGLTEFAAGNKANIVRQVGGEQKLFNVRLEDLLRDGDITANVKVYPGDIIVIPESLF